MALRSGQQGPKLPNPLWLAGRISRINQRLKSMAPEKKRHNVQPTPFNVAVATGDMVNLSHIAEGDSIGTRDGEQITVKSVFVDGYLNMNSAATHSYEYVRLVLFYDKSYNGADPDGTILFESAGDPFSTRNDTYKPNVAVLADKKILLDSVKSPSMKFRLSKSWKNGLRINYNGSGAADSNGRANQLMLYVCTDASANGAKVTFGGRVTFHD